MTRLTAVRSIDFAGSRSRNSSWRVRNSRTFRSWPPESTSRAWGYSLLAPTIEPSASKSVFWCERISCKLPIVRDEIIERLTLDDDASGAVADEHNGGAREPVVVAGHRLVVRAGGLDGEQIAGMGLRHLGVPDQDVGLTVLAGDGDDLIARTVGVVGEEALVPGVVKLRARVVRHAAV